MAILGTVLGVLLLLVVLGDTFETIVLPRTVTRKVRLARFFYLSTWRLWSAIGRRLVGDDRRDAFLGIFGPLSLLLLICVWAIGLIFGFTLILWGLGTQLYGERLKPGFGTDLYLSGSTFFTLSFGDVIPRTPLARFLTVSEAGLGLGFLALVISYLPILYQSFSRREVGISLLDARAGTPPTGGELLIRHGRSGNMEALISHLQEWERWASDLLESHLSFPVLVYYRSQHDRESWLSALIAILDACALISVGFEGDPPWQARLQWQAHLTFAMTRHAVVDLALIMRAAPGTAPDRLPPEALARLQADLTTAGIPPQKSRTAEQRLTAIRNQYEPYVCALAKRLLLALPSWSAAEGATDNWQTSAWDQEEHF